VVIFARREFGKDLGSPNTLGGLLFFQIAQISVGARHFNCGGVGFWGSQGNRRPRAVGMLRKCLGLLVSLTGGLQGSRLEVIRLFCLGTIQFSGYQCEGPIGKLTLTVKHFFERIKSLQSCAMKLQFNGYKGVRPFRDKFS